MTESSSSRLPVHACAERPPNRSRYHRLGRVILGMIGVALFVGSPAYAAGSKPSKTGPVVTFGVEPASASKPDGRSYFDYNGTPGGQVADHVAVNNFSFQTITLTVHTSDAVNTADGGFALLPPTKKSTDIGTWFDIPTAGIDVVVPPRSFRVIPIEVKIPSSATPGDHIGGISVTLASTVVSPSGQRIKLLQSVGTRFFLRVSGALHPGLTIVGLKVRYKATLNPLGEGSAVVTFSVRNTGNVGIGGKQTVWISGLFGSKTFGRSLPQVPLLLPGYSVPEKVVFPKVFPELDMTAHVSISPLYIPGSVQPASGPYRADIGFWAIPWILLAAIAVVVLALVGWFVRRRRRRQRLRSMRVTPPKSDDSGSTTDATAEDATGAGEPAPSGWR